MKPVFYIAAVAANCDKEIQARDLAWSEDDLSKLFRTQQALIKCKGKFFESFSFDSPQTLIDRFRNQPKRNGQSQESTTNIPQVVHDKLIATEEPPKVRQNGKNEETETSENIKIRVEYSSDKGLQFLSERKQVGNNDVESDHNDVESDHNEVESGDNDVESENNDVESDNNEVESDNNQVGSEYKEAGLEDKVVEHNGNDENRKNDVIAPLESEKNAARSWIPYLIGLIVSLCVVFLLICCLSNRKHILDHHTHNAPAIYAGSNDMCSRQTAYTTQSTRYDRSRQTLTPGISINNLAGDLRAM